MQSFPQDWLAILGERATVPIRVLTPDLSTVTAFADVVLQLGDTLLHLDFQSGPDPDLSRRILLYNVLLHDHYGMPVHSMVMLLRPGADRPDLTGEVRYQARPERGGLNFRFEVLRLWEQPVETLMAGQLGTLPLALLCRPPEGQAPEEALVLREAEEVLSGRTGNRKD